MKIVIDDEKIIDLLETEWGYEGIREDTRRLLIENGIPLPKVIAEIETEIEHMASRQYDYNLTLDRQEVLEVLDRYIIEAESVKDCKACRHSEETDGSNCYKCVKGIKDNFEANKGEEWRKLTPAECLRNGMAWFIEKR